MRPWAWTALAAICVVSVVIWALPFEVEQPPSRSTVDGGRVSNEVSTASLETTIDTVEFAPSPTSPDTQLGSNSSVDSAAGIAVAEPVRERIIGRPVRIQLLNGTKVKGLARQVSRGLREKGFDVREVGNAGIKTERCEIIDRSGADSLGRAVADSLGVSPARIRNEENASLVDIDVTLVLGTDFEQLKLNIQR